MPLSTHGQAKVTCAFLLSRCLDGSLPCMFGSILSSLFLKAVRPSFYTWLSNCSSTICWKDDPFSIHCLFSFVQDQLNILVWPHFWALYFVPLTPPSWFWNLMNQWCRSSNSAVLCWLVSVFRLSTGTSKLLCWYPQNNLLGFWLGLSWIYRPSFRRIDVT
jgi:hypothetical protein